jgi:hypothetical protein
LIVTSYGGHGDEDSEERVIVIRGKGVATARKQATAKAQSALPKNVEEKDPNAWIGEFQDWLRRMRRRRGR